MDVKTLCLGVLSMGDRSGYEIKKTFEEDFRHFFRAGYGSIYPALAELERLGHVVANAVEQARRPDKKVYVITPEGHAALVRSLIGEEPRHVVRSEFLVLMYFAHLLPPERLGQVIDDMKRQFEQIMWSDLQAFERIHDQLTPGQLFALGYGRTVLTAALGYLNRQRGELLRRVENAHTTEDDETRSSPKAHGGVAPERAATGLAAAGD